MNVTQLARQDSTEQPPSQVDALEDAFARYQGELLGTLFYLVGNLEDARDALQETFVKCWRNRDQVAEIRQLKSWIFRVALNTGRDMRQAAWRRRRRALADGEAIADRPRYEPETIVHQQEQMVRLREAIIELRQEEQEVFLLRQNGDMTYDEIAVAIGIPTGTVKTRMRLAVTKLRLALHPNDG
jgi:RNA polymerase sigma-70 factor (ECF subfamily)